MPYYGYQAAFFYILIESSSLLLFLHMLIETEFYVGLKKYVGYLGKSSLS